LLHIYLEEIYKQYIEFLQNNAGRILLYIFFSYYFIGATTILNSYLSFFQMQKDKSLVTHKQKHNRARKLLDLSPGSFIEKVKYKAVEYGKTISFIDKWFPSTKMCSNCTFVMDKMEQSIREWICPSCGQKHNRDHNAAKNILREGTSSLGIGNVRLESACAFELLPF
jgi:Transposase and inactivated derivatives